MRKSKFASIILIIFLALVISSLHTNAQTIIFEKTFGGINDDRGASVKQTVDGGYIIVGSSASYGAGSIDVYLIKTNASGNILWTKTFGGSNSENACSVEQTVDGGFIITALTKSFGDTNGDFYLIKTDNDGNLLWSKTYGGSSLEDYAEDGQQTSDGGYIIVGETKPFGTSWKAWDIYLIKTDSNGDPLWSKTYGGLSQDSGYSVQQTTDGGYIIGALTNSFGSGDYDIYLIKTNATGETLWTKTFGGNDADFVSSVQETADGGYIILGSTESYGAGNRDIWLIKIGSVNNPPQFISLNAAIAYEDSVFEYTAIAIDPEDSVITYTFKDYPSWLSPADSTISGIPQEGAKDTSFVVIASDGELTDTLFVSITVISINDSPKIINLSNFTFENTHTYIINLDTCVSDEDHQPSSMSWNINPLDENLQTNIVNNVALFSAPNWSGETYIKFNVTDPEGASDSLVVKGTVIPPSSVYDLNKNIPEYFSLEQNFPNPFNPKTNIIFGLPKLSNVSISIFNLSGKFVAEIFKGRKQAGYHTVTWDASNYSAGTYFIKMEGDDFIQIKKCVLLK